MRQVALNALIAVLWVLFQDEDSFRFSTFFSGYIIGIIIIYLLHKFFDQEFYPKKVWIVIKFLATYLYQLVTSSMTTMYYILFKTNDINPGLLTYESELSRDWEVTFLTILIIITPGSSVIRISEDTNKFFIHAMDVSDKEKDALLKNIRQYERLILEVTR